MGSMLAHERVMEQFKENPQNKNSISFLKEEYHKEENKTEGVKHMAVVANVLDTK